MLQPRCLMEELAEETVVIEAGRPFGGEWPEQQLWQIVEREGRMSCEATSPSVHVRAGDGYRFAAGERRLIMAETKMQILIGGLEWLSWWPPSRCGPSISKAKWCAVSRAAATGYAAANACIFSGCSRSMAKDSVRTWHSRSGELRRNKRIRRVEVVAIVSALRDSSSSFIYPFTVNKFFP